MGRLTIAVILPFGVVPWFPQEQAESFFVAKGLIALVSTLLLVWHMVHQWPRLEREATLGQRMRYLTLLAFSVLVTGSSAEQVTEGALVSYRHLGALLVSLLLFVTVVISIRDDRRRDRAEAQGG